MNILFIDSDGREYTAYDIVETLKGIGAHDCDNLFIHSDIMFGKTPSDFNRKEYMNILVNIFEELSVKNIIMPTFSYSFCNDEVYDVQKSRSSMGALSEAYRKMDGRYRTMDPILSVSVPVELKSKFENNCDYSLGVGSALDVIHSLDGTKFLFFGTPMGECFTYLHYIEKMLDVPYRYDQGFSGKIIDYEGKEIEKTQYIHTACYGVEPKNFYCFEDYLQDKGKYKKVKLGDKHVGCIDEKNAYSEIVDMINRDINYFLVKPYTEADLEHKYTKGLDGVRITHC